MTPLWGCSNVTGVDRESPTSGGRIGIRPIPCSQVIFDDRQIGDYRDCEVGGYIVYMTPSEVFQRWGSVYEVTLS